MNKLLLLVSFIGSIIGFFVCYQIFVKLQITKNRLAMRICMINSMSLAFIFAMFIELSTGSKGLSVIIPVVSICLPIFWLTRFNIIDTIEACTATLMSVSMSAMLIGMADAYVVLTIQSILVSIEVILGFTVSSKAHV